MKKLDYLFKTFLLGTALMLISIYSNAQDVSFQVTPDTYGCAPFNVSIINTSTIDTNGITFYWSFSDGTNAEGWEPDHVFENANNHNIHVDAMDEFSNHYGSYDVSIDVGGSSGEFYTNTGLSACPGENINFWLNNVWWAVWDMGDGTIDSNQWVNHTYMIEGIYDVIVIFETDCGIDTIFEQFEVSDLAFPIAEIQTNGGEFCPDDMIHFTNGYNASSYLWNFGGGNFSMDSEPDFSFSELGPHSVILTVTNSCGQSNTDTTEINIGSDVNAWADFGFDGGDICPGNDVNFYAWSPGLYYWDFDDGNTSTETNPMHAFADTGSYNVMLIVSNNCSNADTAYNEVYVSYNDWNIPDAYIGFENFDNWDEYGEVMELTVCPGTEVIFDNYTCCDNNYTYLWDFGDGDTSIEMSVSHIFDIPGYFEVSMIAYSNCGGSDTAYRWINVDPNMMPDSTLEAIPDTICPGELVYFMDNNNYESNENIYSIWFGDGDSLVNFTEPQDTIFEVLSTHEYSDLGTYQFVFSVTNDCGNTYTMGGEIVVSSQGATNPFYYVGNSTQNNDYQEQPDFTDISTASGPNDHEFDIPMSINGWEAGMNEDIYLVFWYGGINTLENDPGEPAGIVEAIGPITSVSGFVPTIEDSIFIAAVWWCDAAFDGEPDGIGISGAYELIPASFSLLDTIYIDIYNTCDSIFTEPNPDAGCPGDPVEFFAAGGLTHEWHFGDGAPPVEAQFTYHVYADTGFYDAFVVITNGCGDQDTVSSPVEIGTWNVPDAYFWVDNGWGCTYDTLNFYPEDGDYFGYTYLWDFGDGSTSMDVEPQHVYTEPGQYFVSLTVTNGCGTSMQSSEVYISGPWVDYMVDPGCYGEDNASISLNVGGNWPMSYEWSTGETTEAIENLVPGTYYVTVIDGDGCSSIKSIEVIEAEMLEVFIYNEDVDCYGNNSGSAMVALVSGNEPVNFIWSTGDNNQEIYDLYAGTYIMTAMDVNGCFVADTIEITEPEELLTTTTSSDVSCFDYSDGTASVSVSGGTTPYSYSWSSGEISSNIEFLITGSYSVIVTDDNGCEIFDTAFVDEPVLLEATITGSDALCFGENNGAADLVVTGGIQPYSYNWSTGETTEDISGLTAGDYEVYVDDDNGCITEAVVMIGEQFSEIIISINTDNAACSSSDGKAWVESLTGGGSGPYSYLWNDPMVSPTDTAFNLEAGAYTVEVTSSDGCIGYAVATVINDGAASIDSILIEDVSCFGQCDGIAQVFVSGGVSPYTYDWSTGSNTDSIGSLCAGTYIITATDYSLCVTVAEVEIFEPEVLSSTQDISHVNCYGDSTGSIDIIISGGTSPITYLWGDGETTESLIDLVAGSYNVTITDYNLCDISATIIVNENDEIITSISGTDVSCFGEANGVADLLISGGEPPYDYSWSNGATSQDATGLAAEIYYVDINDANGCYSADSVTITEPAELIAYVSDSVDNTCFNSCDGLATVLISGGTTPYSYYWNTAIPQNSATATDLCAGTYFVDVVDDNGCISGDEVTIDEPDDIDANPVITQPLCFGETGSVVLNLFGGTPPYTENWGGADEGALDPGIYTVIVTDDNGCSADGEFEIENTPEELGSFIDITDASSVVATDGSAIVFVDGGIAPYTYLWSTGEVAMAIYGLTVDEYCVTITDAVGCETFTCDSVLSATGLSDHFMEFGHRIYPNPTEGLFIIETYNTSETHIEIVDVLGKMVYVSEISDGKGMINLANECSGVYFVKIYSDSKLTIDKIILRH